MLTIYKIISYLLLPVALLLGLVSIIGLFIAFGNLAVLFPVFITGSTVIYIIVAFMFLQRGIEADQRCKPSLKDWIKVNAYVALFFGISLCMQSFLLLRQPELLQEVMKKAMTMQGNKLPQEMLMQSMTGLMWAMLVLGAVLAIHVIMTLRLLRQYAAAFLPGPQQ